MLASEGQSLKFSSRNIWIKINYQVLVLFNVMFKLLRMHITNLLFRL